MWKTNKKLRKNREIRKVSRCSKSICKKTWNMLCCVKQTFEKFQKNTESFEYLEIIEMCRRPMKNAETVLEVHSFPPKKRKMSGNLRYTVV